MDKILLYRMHPEDRAQIESVLEAGKSRWDVMVGLDQPNFKFALLERRTLKDGKDRFVMQGKLFGLLVVLFTSEGICESFEILENEDAMAERDAIAGRMTASTP
jgi:hypothetical protein